MPPSVSPLKVLSVFTFDDRKSSALFEVSPETDLLWKNPEICRHG